MPLLIFSYSTNEQYTPDEQTFFSKRGRFVTLTAIIIQPADGNQIEPVLEGIDSTLSFMNNKLCNKDQTWTSNGNDRLCIRTFLINNKK